MREVLTFLSRWSPYIWLFGSIFGVLLSSILLKRSYEQRVVLRVSDRRAMSRYWFRHALWFFLLHSSYVVVGVLSILKFESDWASVVILVSLVGTPLVLVYRSYDSLRAAGSDG